MRRWGHTHSQDEHAHGCSSPLSYLACRASHLSISCHASSLLRLWIAMMWVISVLFISHWSHCHPCNHTKWPVYSHLHIAVFETDDHHHQSITSLLYMWPAGAISTANPHPMPGLGISPYIMKTRGRIISYTIPWVVRGSFHVILMHWVCITLALLFLPTASRWSNKTEQLRSVLRYTMLEYTVCSIIIPWQDHFLAPILNQEEFPIERTVSSWRGGANVIMTIVMNNGPK